ncbi:hypothetical protein [Pseudanabaena cinerea]|nr:hypothetical protein [Pseudanabaena cinerea]
MLRGMNSCDVEGLGLARTHSPYKKLNYSGRGNPPVVALAP